MSKIISIHTLEPASGANMADFEAFMQELADGAPFQAAGWRSYVVKGDRGARKGKFVVVHEFASVEARNRYFPVEGGDPPAETMQLMSTFGTEDMDKRWNALVSENDVYTDYILPD